MKKKAFSLIVVLLLAVAVGFVWAQERAPRGGAAAAPRAGAARGPAMGPIGTLTVRGAVALIKPDEDTVVVVTDEGKLVYLGYDEDTKVIDANPKPAKIEDLKVQQSVTITYEPKRKENVATAIEFRAPAARR